MIKVIKCKMKMVKGDSVNSSLVFRLAGPRINLAVRHFQSFLSLSGTEQEITQYCSEFLVYYSKQESTNSKHFLIHKTPVHSMPN